MKQPYVSTLIEQDFTSAEKALGRHNIDAISSADLEGYATQEWVQDQNYITSADLPDVSDMATKTWTSENFYPDTNPSGFITSSDVPRYREGDYISIDPITLAISVTGINPDNYVTQEDLEFATSGKIDSTEASAFYPRYDNPEGYITSADLPDFHVYSAGQYVNIEGDTINVTGVYPDTNPSGFATSSWVVEQNYITSADVPAAQEYSAGQYVSIVDHVVSVTGLQPEGDYLTSGDLEDYATKQYVDENFYSASNPSGFITSADIPHIQQVQSNWTEDDSTDPSYIQNKPSPVGLEAISPLYITDETSASKIGIYSSAFPDMNSYATKVYVNSATSGKQDKLTFGYTDNLISSINSSGIYGAGGTFIQEQSDWTEANTASASYIKHKPSPVGLTAGPGITLTDNGTSIEISSTGGGSGYATVECQAISVEYSAYIKAIYPQSSACCELHVTTPYRYDAVAEYSAKINDDRVWAIPSGAWYDFVKQDCEGTQEWCFKDSGHIYA